MNANRRDDFVKGVRDVLAHRAGFRCSKPDCRAPTAGPNDDNGKHGSIGIAAHITAAAPGGPRYDPTLSADLRGAVSNGIWLCDNHAREVDRDGKRFTVEILQAWKEHAEGIARAMLGRPISSNALDVAVDVALLRDLYDGIAVVGETNLPEGTKIMVDLRSAGAMEYHAQASGCVTARRIFVGPFMLGESPLPQRWYQIELCAYFNEAWAQPAHVVDMTGFDGAKLGGKLISPLDPDLDESEYAVRAFFECPAPATQLECALGDAEIIAAIGALKESVLRVPGHTHELSSECVGDVVNRFMGAPGLREREGWQAVLAIPGVVEVTYSFWDGQCPGLARWQVIPRSGEVRYRNRSAKQMSWSPDY